MEPLAVWAFFGLATLAVLVTYSRLPPEELYNVSGSGIEGGAGRALVFLNYPTALAVLAVLAVVAERLRGTVEIGLAVAAAMLCATVGVPGVVDQSDLDARPVNGLAAGGVAIAAVLTIVALARGGLGRSAPFGRADVARLVVAGILFLASLPWFAAELGFYIDDVPGLDSVFLAEDPYAERGEPAHAAVHLGEHHGTDGILLAWTALLLSRVRGSLQRPALRAVFTGYLALMLVYGLALALEDFWLEQLVKRGATSLRLPNMIRPDASPEWAAILAASVLVAVVWFRLGRVRRPGRRFQ